MNEMLRRLPQGLKLFLALEAVDFVLIITHVFEYGGNMELVRARGDVLYNLTAAALLISILAAVFAALTVVLFLKRKQGFLINFIISKVLTILEGFAGFILVISTGGSSASNLFNAAVLILSVIFSFIMLTYWLNYFKDSKDIRIYMNKNQSRSPVSKRRRPNHLRRIK